MELLLSNHWNKFDNLSSSIFSFTVSLRTTFFFSLLVFKHHLFNASVGGLEYSQAQNPDLSHPILHHI